MRKLLLLLIAAVAIMSCKTQQKSEPEKTLAQQLEERMDSLYKKGYMAGHQDDPFYVIRSMASVGLTKTVRAT